MRREESSPRADAQSEGSGVWARQEQPMVGLGAIIEAPGRLRLVGSSWGME